MEDTRNVTDEFKGVPHDMIVVALDKRGVKLEVAVENLERDFSMGTIMRTANAFGVRHVHVVGRRQWNKRGAMMTDKYLHIHYYETPEEFAYHMREAGKAVVAVDNVEGATMLHDTELPENAVMVFGSEGNGLSPELLAIADATVMIEQFGSTRSINVAIAAGVVMYAWLQKHTLGK